MMGTNMVTWLLTYLIVGAVVIGMVTQLRDWSARRGHPCEDLTVREWFLALLIWPLLMVAGPIYVVRAFLRALRG